MATFEIQLGDARSTERNIRAKMAAFRELYGEAEYRIGPGAVVFEDRKTKKREIGRINAAMRVVKLRSGVVLVRGTLGGGRPEVVTTGFLLPAAFPEAYREVSGTAPVLFLISQESTRG